MKFLNNFNLIKIAQDLGEPRFMAWLPPRNNPDICGTLLVADRSDSGRILELSGTGSSPPKIWASDLDYPTSLSIYGDYVYVGEQTKVSRLKLNKTHSKYPDKGTLREIIVSGLPAEGHSTKTVLVFNGKLYVSIGSSCNSCIETDPKRATVMVYDLEKSSCLKSYCDPRKIEGHVYSSGLRNSVGLAVNPWTKEIWATTNGSDYLGDDIPPDTIDILRQNTFYGWPYCHAGRIPDPQLSSSKNACQGLPQPVVLLPAHSAPLGLAFYDPRNPRMPPGFPRGLYVALHGSWNRSQPVGYSIVFIPLDESGNVNASPQTIVEWPKDLNGVRPVGLTFGICGLYVSDDRQGNVFLLYNKGV